MAKMGVMVKMYRRSLNGVNWHPEWEGDLLEWVINNLDDEEGTQPFLNAHAVLRNGAVTISGGTGGDVLLMLNGIYEVGICSGCGETFSTKRLWLDGEGKWWCGACCVEDRCIACGREL